MLNNLYKARKDYIRSLEQIIKISSELQLSVGDALTYLEDENILDNPDKYYEHRHTIDPNQKISCIDKNIRQIQYHLDKADGAQRYICEHYSNTK